MVLLHNNFECSCTPLNFTRGSSNQFVNSWERYLILKLWKFSSNLIVCFQTSVLCSWFGLLSGDFITRTLIQFLNWGFWLRRSLSRYFLKFFPLLSTVRLNIAQLRHTTELLGSQYRWFSFIQVQVI